MILIDGEWSFIHIPKNSGSNLRKIFLRSNHRVENFCYENPEKLNDLIRVSKFFWSENNLEEFSNTINLYKDVNLKWCHHAPVSCWQESNIITNQKIFTISRNPFTRFVSFCNNIIEKAGLLIPQMSLKEFIHSSYLEDSIKFFSPKYNYKTNQVEFLTDQKNSIRLDKFYRIETDLLQLQEDFNLTDINTFMYNKGNYERDFSKIYTDASIRLVQNVFSKDFYYFGYDLNPFW